MFHLSKYCEYDILNTMNSSQVIAIVRADLKGGGDIRGAQKKLKGASHNGFDESDDGSLLVVYFADCTVVLGIGGLNVIDIHATGDHFRYGSEIMKLMDAAFTGDKEKAIAYSRLLVDKLDIGNEPSAKWVRQHLEVLMGEREAELVLPSAGAIEDRFTITASQRKEMLDMADRHGAFEVYARLRDLATDAETVVAAK